MKFLVVLRYDYKLKVNTMSQMNNNDEGIYFLFNISIKFRVEGLNINYFNCLIFVFCSSYTISRKNDVLSTVGIFYSLNKIMVIGVWILKKQWIIS